MPNRLSIFSSRLIRSALLWTIVMVALIEGTAAYYMPGHYPSHLVDERLYALDHDQTNSPVLLLGDSVAQQMGPGLEKAYPGTLRSLTCNLMIETTGQYYLFRRYLEHHPPPKTIVLIMGSPLRGNLNTTFTENYVQRCFLRWREILEISQEKRSPVFTATMLTYKLFPTLRYRTHLQRFLPWMAVDSPRGGANQGETPVHKQPTYGLVSLLNKLTPHPAGPSDISAHYLQRLAYDTDHLGIRLVVVMRPMPEARRKAFEPGNELGLEMDELKALARLHPSLHAIPDVVFYPDDWFEDVIHLKPDYVESATKDFQKLLGDLP